MLFDSINVQLCLPKDGIRGEHVLLLTPAQINRLDRAQVEGRRVQIRMITGEVAKNVSYTGVLPGMLASFAARADGINKAISGSGVVDGLYLHKHDKCYRVQKYKGNGLNLAPHPRFVEGDGLFMKHGNHISDGACLLMGKNSPFKNIPVLGWLL